VFVFDQRASLETRTADGVVSFGFDGRRKRGKRGRENRPATVMMETKQKKSKSKSKDGKRKAPMPTRVFSAAMRLSLLALPTET
jgi:hypothetical protein